jgi:hypothetical protein
MLAKTMTTKQRYWLKQVTAADASGGTISEYASEQGLQLKALYAWKTKLTRLGLYQTSLPESNSPFVAVQPRLSEQQQQEGCAVSLANGTRIEFTGALDSKAIRTIITSAGLKR